MEINVTGRKMNVGEALTDHIKTRLSGVADKYFSRSIDSSATVTKEGHICRVDISMHPNQGIQLHGRGEADDPYAAFDIAADKVEKQLRRYKRRLKNHHISPSKEIAVEMARENVLAPEQEDDESSDVPDQPLIIAETKKEIPSVSVGDAVMLMDLADSSAFVFRNVKGDGLEVVYRRKDGNIGWITPSN